MIVAGQSDQSETSRRAAAAAWLLASLYYFYQYVMRSAPAVMMPQLSAAFGLPAAGVGAMVGLFYWGYAPFSLAAGAAMDRLGPRRVMPIGAALVGVGALLFATGDRTLASLGSFLQGAAGVFALVGAAYLASKHFPASMAATLIGATQMFGMAGGSAGQFLVGPAMAHGLPWRQFWIAAGLAGAPLALLILLFTPKSPAASGGRGEILQALAAVLKNRTTLLCGAVAGLMFLPTTIFSMVWGVRFLQDSHDMPFTAAVLRSAAVPAGWIIGCPALGALSDRIGRRKPVIVGGAAALAAVLLLILFGPAGVFPPYSLGLVAGIASGAAMLPYTVNKEANRPEHAGTATGVLNFLNFGLSALLGPLFGTLLVRTAGGGATELGHYQTAFTPLAVGAVVAALIALLLPETGPAARAATARAGMASKPPPLAT